MFEAAIFFELMEKMCHKAFTNSMSKGFWDGPENDNVPTKIALMHSELSEMLEAHRKGNTLCDKDITIIDGEARNKETGYQDGVRRITAMEEECADLFIRLLDFCGRHSIDLGRVTIAKMYYNEKRPHMHGKRC